MLILQTAPNGRGTMSHLTSTLLSSLVDNDAASCLDAAQGLRIPDDVTFGGRVEMSPHAEVSEGSEGSVPRLLFSCSLDGPKIVCPL
jgi:hypothetical protein